jgi:hypothetical protein
MCTYQVTNQIKRTNTTFYKTKLPKVIPDPEWILFEKCMRGDPTDNVFSAYPGVRKTKLQEAFGDLKNKGFAWNNLMLTKWIDHNKQEHKVLDDYNRNRVLVDLTAQPDDIKVKIAETIAQGSVQLNRPMVGAQFLKFCGKYELNKLSENPSAISSVLSASYPG